MKNIPFNSSFKPKTRVNCCCTSRVWFLYSKTSLQRRSTDLCKEEVEFCILLVLFWAVVIISSIFSPSGETLSGELKLWLAVAAVWLDPGWLSWSPRPWLLVLFLVLITHQDPENNVSVQQRSVSLA